VSVRTAPAAPPRAYTLTQGQGAALTFGPRAAAPLLPRAGAPHPLEDSDHLAWQATASVSLLERFGDLVVVALDAVGRGDDAALVSALGERDRLVQQLQPLLGALSGARQYMAGAPPHTAAARAVDEILAPVDDALRHAQVLHSRLSDEVRERGWESAESSAALAR
jgi:hypothetical protein